MRLFIVYFFTMLLGVAIALGVASLVGLVWHAAMIPVFLIISIWWLWIGWKYARARDRKRY